MVVRRVVNVLLDKGSSYKQKKSGKTPDFFCLQQIKFSIKIISNVQQYPPAVKL